MKVNIILITYNQQHYIRQTLDSILIQQVNGDVEIIVADDCSTDDTLSIIKEYTSESRFQFTFLPKSPNLGYVKNYQRAFDACDGDYVTIMEGDDYWTSPSHIQNQINFLESHSDCSMTFNRHIRLFENQDREEVFEWLNNNSFEYITTEQLTLGNKIGNLSCCTLRGKLVRKLDPKLFDMNIADWMLGMYMGQFGSIAYLKEVTSAYRIHDNGQWSKIDDREQCLKIIELIDQYDKYFKYKYTKTFTQHKKRLQILLYGDKSIKGRIKQITPLIIRNAYRKLKGY